ncbi:CBS domain [Musa troglodytarum]|uniref:CBS domain n=1 Tax=Musa troglodytarum TaxID=320322 RepID=A0A9E7EYR2_9LILI|nr:CBS domain [Musa troglodytarum]
MWYCVAFIEFPYHECSFLVSEAIYICNLTKQFRDHTKINYHLQCPTCPKHQSKYTREADSYDQRWGLTSDAVFSMTALEPSFESAADGGDVVVMIAGFPSLLMLPIAQAPTLPALLRPHVGVKKPAAMTLKLFKEKGSFARMEIPNFTSRERLRTSSCKEGVRHAFLQHKRLCSRHLNIHERSFMVFTTTAEEQAHTPFWYPTRLQLSLLNQGNNKVMQGVVKAIQAHGNRLKHAVLQHLRFTDGFYWPNIVSRFETAISTPRIPHKGLENITVYELLKAKGEEEKEVVYWCRTSDTVYDAVQNMTQHNIGALVVIKPEDEKLLAGIVTERDYLRKIIVQGKSSTSTRVGEIMTDEFSREGKSNMQNLLFNVFATKDSLQLNR